MLHAFVFLILNIEPSIVIIFLQNWKTNNLWLPSALWTRIFYHVLFALLSCHDCPNQSSIISVRKRGFWILQEVNCSRWFVDYDGIRKPKTTCDGIWARVSHLTSFNIVRLFDFY